MAEAIGLIERAAALLRERDVPRPAEQEQAKPSPLSAESDRQPPAGEILDIGALANQGITLPSDRRSRTAEEFRLIKHNLLSVWQQQGASLSDPTNRLIMVASPLSGEGKTFVALNLALAFASAKDHSSLLIDTDTNHPLVPSLFRVTPEKGIVDVLAGRCQLHDALLRTSVPGLEILPAGQHAPDVPELLSSRRMRALLSELAERHHDRYVIIDTPPCLITSEATALAGFVGQIVFVIEAHRTQRQEIEAGLNLLGSCPRISLLLNKSDQMASEHFGSYGSYYYHSGGKSEDQSEGGT
jgi:protein-tyrosine kinase